MVYLKTELSNSGSATRLGVPHIPDFLRTSAGSANLMRLSLKKAHTPSCPGPRAGNSGYLAVFREMWDTTALHLRVLRYTQPQARNHVANLFCCPSCFGSPVCRSRSRPC